MATTKPFAYNTGSTILNTLQYGSIAIGINGTYDFSTNPGGVQWWMGPDQDLGYIVVVPDPTFSQPTPGAGLQFWRSDALTDGSFLNLANGIARMKGHSIFTGATDASNWLVATGYPSSYVTWLGPENMTNAGLITTGSDWVDSNSDGYANGWQSTYGANITPSIINGINGFLDRAQRVEVISSYYVGLLCPTFNMLASKRYQISYDTRANYVWASYASGGQGLYTGAVGDEVIHSYSFQVTILYGGYLQFYAGLDPPIGTYIEVDNVSIKEVF